MASVLLTLILREDGLELVESSSVSRDLQPLRQQARLLASRLRQQQHTPFGQKTKVSVDSDKGPYCLLLVVSGALTFVTVCDNKYSKKLALMFVEEIEREFSQSYSAQRVAAASEAFAFQSFETFINKSRALYEDSTAKHNADDMAKVQNELHDVYRIMSQNVQDILDRGAKLDSVANKSDDLFAESRKFKAKASDLRWRQLWRTYGTYAGVGVGVIFVLLVRFYVFA